MSATRTRADRCPGALRPWPSADGLLVRLRLIGGRVSTAAVRSLVGVAEEYGDGRVQLTSRANLQVRALPGRNGQLTQEALAAVQATGLLPTRTHELVRNVMVSPQTGTAGGRTDLRPVGEELDERLRADAELSSLPGRFLFVLDDGRGDLMERPCDLGLVAVDPTSAQLRVGSSWGPVVPLDEGAARLAGLAHDFLVRRGTGPTAPWHVCEVAAPLLAPAAPDPRLPRPAPPLRFGPVPGGRHVEAPAAGLDRDLIEELTATVDHVIVTPWRGVLIPKETR